MTEQEAFEAWWEDHRIQSHPECKPGPDWGAAFKPYAKLAWHAALAWLRSQGEPIGVIGFDTLLWKKGIRPPEHTLLYTTPQLAIPDGWQLVPVEPTKEMRVVAVQERYGMAAYRCTSRDALVLLEEEFAADWKAALDAAPEPVIPAGWQPIETAPKDAGPVLVWHRHDSDPYFSTEGNRLTIFGAHYEGLCNRHRDGMCLAVWGGAYHDAEGSIPDWWFLDDGEFETPLAPTHWMPLPPAPEPHK